MQADQVETKDKINGGDLVEKLGWLVDQLEIRPAEFANLRKKFLGRL
jgi:hypothetical protein